MLGHFRPSAYVSRGKLLSRGFDQGRVRWMSLPHISGSEIRGAFGGDSERVVSSLFSRIGNEDLFLFRPEVGEGAVEGLPIPVRQENGISFAGTTIGLSSRSRKGFSHRRGTGFLPDSYASLQDHERGRFGEILSEYFHESEIGWERTGEAL